MRWDAWHGRALAGLGAGCAILGAGAPAAACGPHVAALYAYEPFLSIRSDGRWEGIDKDMLDELARRSGCELRAVIESRIRIWDQLRSGGAALTLSAVPTPEREAYAELVPYAQGRYHLMLQPEVAARVKTLAAFEADPSLTLLVVKGYVHGPTLDAMVQRLRAEKRVHEVADFGAVLRMARGGRGHALLALPGVWAQAAASFGQQPAWVVLDAAPQDRVLGAMALSRQMPLADRRRLVRAMQAMRADGTVTAILRRHVGEAAARAAAYTDAAGPAS